MDFSRFVKKLFGAEETPNAAPPRPVLVTAHGASFRGGPSGASELPVALEKWTSRDPAFWNDRTSHVIRRLRNDWSANPERAKWPDASELLVQLASPPHELVRQLPAAAREAIALCDNAALSRQQLADKLGRDPSLVQALLRQANGVIIGGGLAPVLRVDAAIDRVGIAATRAIVLASCVDGLISKPGGSYDAMLAAVWTHMVNTGQLARSIAPSLGADVEEAFAIALLHDVGKLVIFDRISALRASKHQAVALPEEWLTSVIEHLHEPLGAVAAHRWGLGARAADAVGSHHRRERPALHHPLAEAIFVSERADHALRKGTRLDFDGIWSLGQLSGNAGETQTSLLHRMNAA